MSEFDQADFSDRYEFSRGRVHRRGSGTFCSPVSDGKYSYYQLTRNDGKRVKVSVNLVSGRVEKVGDLYQIRYWPEGWEIRPGFPAYLFHPGKGLIRRVGWRIPRAEPELIRPDRHGKYRLLTPDGYKWYHHDQLFHPPR